MRIVIAMLIGILLAIGSAAVLVHNETATRPRRPGCCTTTAPADRPGRVQSLRRVLTFVFLILVAACAAAPPRPAPSQVLSNYERDTGNSGPPGLRLQQPAAGQAGLEHLAVLRHRRHPRRRPAGRAADPRHGHGGRRAVPGGPRTGIAD